jgi:hypothetical protein
METISFVIIILATYRTAQIVAQESIFEPVRAWVVKGGLPPENLPAWRRWLGLLIHCAGCVSVWVGWLYVSLGYLAYYRPLSLMFNSSFMEIVGNCLAIFYWVFVLGVAMSGGAVFLGELIGSIKGGQK